MTTTHSIDFSQLAHWQQSAFKNKALVRVLHESALETLENKATPLAMAFHEASVAAVYQQFGFAVFSPESRRLLAVAQSRQTRIPSHSLLEWLDQAAYQQLADFHVLKYLESEPDWLDLSHDFCISIIKRIVVCRPQEWKQVGLEHYPRELLEMLLRVVDLQMLGMRQNSEILSGFDVLLRAQGDHPLLNELLNTSLEQWGRAIDLVLARIAQEPLALLAWRLEAFTTERQILNDARLAVQSLSQEEIELSSLRVIMLCVLVSGFHFGQNEPVIVETPITFSALLKSVDEFINGGSEISVLVANLLGVGAGAPKLQECLESALRMGEQIGVFNWAKVSKNQKGLLLTTLALQVMEPYQELIERSFS